MIIQENILIFREYLTETFKSKGSLCLEFTLKWGKKGQKCSKCEHLGFWVSGKWEMFTQLL